MKHLFFILLIMSLVFGCKRPVQEPEFKSNDISQVIGKMTDAMVNDVTNPPLASRFFAYACLAGYEIVSQNDSIYPSFYGKLNDYPKIEKPKDLKQYSYPLASLLAMMETAGKMQPSGELIAVYEANFLDSCAKAGISEEIINGSLAYARFVSSQILAYAKADKYDRTTTFALYTPSEEEGQWYPTPPGYFAPVEPHFNFIRPFTLNSGNQFKPELPVKFSSDEKSPFYAMLKEVHEQGTHMSEEHKEIAAFWDCNPFALQDKGHLMVGMKKISPGAHWMGITGIVSKDQGFDFSKTMKINALVAISLMDGFIACWDEKFRSNRIRPETAIRKYLDSNWKPLLQTPPFPEYLSGHSTISTAAAEVLSFYVGGNVSFKDTVEEAYGLSAREFNSFHQAAEEAAISRLYGGIHFMDAIVNGQVQGNEVGKWVISTVEEGGAKKVAE